MTKVMPFGDQLRKPTSTWICNACPMAGIRLITAAALAMTLMAGKPGTLRSGLTISRQIGRAHV